MEWASLGEGARRTLYYQDSMAEAIITYTEMLGLATTMCPQCNKTYVMF